MTQLLQSGNSFAVNWWLEGPQAQHSILLYKRLVLARSIDGKAALILPLYLRSLSRCLTPALLPRTLLFSNSGKLHLIDGL